MNGIHCFKPFFIAVLVSLISAGTAHAASSCASLGKQILKAEGTIRTAQLKFVPESSNLRLAERQLNRCFYSNPGNAKRICAPSVRLVRSKLNSLVTGRMKLIAAQDKRKAVQSKLDACPAVY